MQTRALLSIVTINLNNGPGLRQTLQSLESQTWKNFESIIIDGGSTDDSVTVIKKFADRKILPIRKWASESDNGLYHAQNKGIRAAKGEYLLFLNSGDYLVSEETLERLTPDSWKADIVYGNILVKHGFRTNRTNLPETITHEHLYYSTLMHPATFIRRQLFKRIGLYREDFKICADYYFFVKAILKHEVSLSHLKDVISVFPAGGVSSSKKFQAIHQKERAETIQEFFTPRMLWQIANNIETRMNGFKFAILAIPRYFVRWLRMNYL